MDVCLLDHIHAGSNYMYLKSNLTFKMNSYSTIGVGGAKDFRGSVVRASNSLIYEVLVHKRCSGTCISGMNS